MQKKQYFFILLIAVLLSLFASIKIGRASSSLSGSCGAMMSLKQLNEVYWHMLSNGSAFGDGSSESTSVDAMIVLDFDKNTIYMSVTNGTLTRSPTQGTIASYATRTIPSINFSLASGPLPNSFLITDSSGTIPDLLLLPVNSGNTFLIQAKNSKASGVCQKI